MLNYILSTFSLLNSFCQFSVGRYWKRFKAILTKMSTIEKEIFSLNLSFVSIILVHLTSVVFTKEREINTLYIEEDKRRAPPSQMELVWPVATSHRALASGMRSGLAASPRLRGITGTRIKRHGDGNVKCIPHKVSHLGPEQSQRVTVHHEFYLIKVGLFSKIFVLYPFILQTNLLQNAETLNHQ